MSDSLFSPSWYRVEALKPRLRIHVKIHRHEYRGAVWFILQDDAAGRAHRFSPAAYHFIGLMDGERTVQQLWQLTCDQLGDEAPNQDEVIRMLGQFHAADALLCDVPPDSRELFRRYQRHQNMQWRRRLWTPLAIRFPILDPERFLVKTLPAVQPLFGLVGFLLWLCVVIVAAVLAGVHWGELTEDIIDRAVTPENLILLWLIYPLVKAVHELGHAYAVKTWGGEVHEIGIMLLVLIPVPYVDASAATGFTDKHKRMVVGAVGIGVELFLAALALFIWMNAQHGVIRAVAYNVMLIGGVSTLFFNGNPLLRFDGYYVLADALEIPNLGTRANKYWGYLIQRYAFQAREVDNPSHNQWERFWFVFYGAAAFIYRMMIVFVIILYIAGKFFTLGVLLAIWAAITQLLVPVGKTMASLFTNPRLKPRRKRALSVTFAFISLVLALLFSVPAPLWTRADGVTWPPDQSQVRAGSDGFVSSIVVPGGTQVQSNVPLMETQDPFLVARITVLRAQLREFEARLTSEQHRDRVQAAIIREEIQAIKADLARSVEQREALTLISPTAGVFILPGEKDMPGRYLRKGQVVGYVLDPEHLTARVAVSQDEIGLLRRHTQGVKVMLADWDAPSYPSEILREVPGGTNQLPTPALGTAGGGSFAVSPQDSSGRTTLERIFQLEVSLPPEVTNAFVGGRVFVRFDHGYEPLGFQVYRSMRQLFLRRFGV